VSLKRTASYFKRGEKKSVESLYLGTREEKNGSPIRRVVNDPWRIE
jgi:hypothetical protein